MTCLVFERWVLCGWRMGVGAEWGASRHVAGAWGVVPDVERCVVGLGMYFNLGGAKVQERALGGS